MNPSQVLILPGWQNSGASHWQSRWEALHGYARVQQHDWMRPLRGDWIARLEIILSDKAEKIFTPFDRFVQFRESKGKTMKDLLDELNDALGKIIYSKKILMKNGLNINPLPIDNISAGIYFIKITSSGQMLTLKIFLN